MTPEEQAHAAALAGLGHPSTPPAAVLAAHRRRLVVLRGAVAAALVGFRTTQPRNDQSPLLPSSFAPYVDVTATPQFGVRGPDAVGGEQRRARLRRRRRRRRPASPAGARPTRCLRRPPTWTSTAASPGCASAAARPRSPSAGPRNSELAIGCTDEAALDGGLQVGRRPLLGHDDRSRHRRRRRLGRRDVDARRAARDRGGRRPPSRPPVTTSPSG